MDNTFHQEESDAQQPASFSIRLPGVYSLFKWLAELIAPTEEEQENAGVYLGGEGRDRRTGQVLLPRCIAAVDMTLTATKIHNK